MFFEIERLAVSWGILRVVMKKKFIKCPLCKFKPIYTKTSYFGFKEFWITSHIEENVKLYARDELFYQCPECGIVFRKVVNK